MADLKPVYRAVSKDAAENGAGRAGREMGSAGPVVLQSWRRKWENLSAYFRYPANIRSHLHHECNRMVPPSTGSLQTSAFPE